MADRSISFSGHFILAI